MNIYSCNYKVELTDADRDAIRNAFFIISLISDTMEKGQLIIQDRENGEFFTDTEVLTCKNMLSWLSFESAKLEILKCGGL